MARNKSPYDFLKEHIRGIYFPLHYGKPAPVQMSLSRSNFQNRPFEAVVKVVSHIKAGRAPPFNMISANRRKRLYPNGRKAFQIRSAPSNCLSRCSQKTAARRFGMRRTTPKCSAKQKRPARPLSRQAKLSG